MAIAKPSITYAWAESGAVTDPGVAKTQTGWISEIPTYQNFNWLLNRQDVFNQHVNERGVPEWDAITTYIQGSLVTASNGNLYKSQSLVNLGNDPILSDPLDQDGAEWVLQVKDEAWFSNGDTPVYVGAFTITIPGDVTAFYTDQSRIKIKGPTMGVIYADVDGSIFVTGNTHINIAVDGGLSLVNESYDYIKISTIPVNGNNLPYGLSGLNLPEALLTRNTTLRRVNTASGRKITAGFPDVFVDHSINVGGNPDIINDGVSFVKIVAAAAANRIEVSRAIAGPDAILRVSLNKGAWASTTFDATVQTFDLGANGVIELTVCNWDDTDPEILNFYAETDALDNIFSWVSLSKKHSI